MLTADEAEAVDRLHDFRNSAYHRGLRHEGILHSLAAFYVDLACSLLSRIQSSGRMGLCSEDKISHRARKYLGREVKDVEKRFHEAWPRLREVTAALDAPLTRDLHGDMETVITDTDHDIQFLLEDGWSNKISRAEIVVMAQASAICSTQEGLTFASRHGRHPKQPDFFKWMVAEYPYPFRADPIPSWKARLAKLRREADKARALSLYCSFMRATESLRLQIADAAADLQGWIQEQIDIARGK